jgi:hypothetical protein
MWVKKKWSRNRKITEEFEFEMLKIPKHEFHFSYNKTYLSSASKAVIVSRENVQS